MDMTKELRERMVNDFLDVCFGYRKGLPKRDYNLGQGSKSTSQMERIAKFQKAMIFVINNYEMCSFNGAPYVFDGWKYIPIRWEELETIVTDVMMRAHYKDVDMLKLEPVFHSVKRYLLTKELHVDSSKMVFHNGVYDVEKGEFMSNENGSVIVEQITSVPYDYNPNDICYLWYQFLNSVLPEKKYQNLLQEFLGCMFIDRKRYKVEKMCILYGKGANGKSVVFDTIMGLVGHENVTPFGLRSLVGGSDQKRNIASINGKRLNYTSELKASTFGYDSTDNLKSLISGEPMDARAMYGDNFVARDIPLIMANCNNLPTFGDTSNGMRRRIMIIPFNVTITRDKQKPWLANELKTEYSGIFNWIMEGRKRFIANGYRFSSTGDIKAQNETLEGCNSVLTFLASQGMDNSDANVLDAMPYWISQSELYMNYTRWCRDEKQIIEVNKVFSQTLTNAGYQKKMSGGKTKVAIYGKAANGMLGTIYGGKRKTKVMTSYLEKQDDGTLITKSKTEMSKVTGLSTYNFNKLSREGHFADCVKMHGRIPIYNITMIIDEMRKMGMYVSKAEKEAVRKREKEQEKARKVFNHEMAKLKLPYRKFKQMGQDRDFCVHVPDDWVYDSTHEYTEEDINAIRLN